MSENSIESVLSMISSNPELINKISSAVQGGGDDLSKSLSSVISLISESQKSNDNTSDLSKESSEKLDTPAGKIENADDLSHEIKADSILSTLSRSIAKNSSFLLALKPYLSKNRCEIIDTVVKISQLASVMNLAK